MAVKNAMEFDNIETVKRAVEIDAGISIVPETTVVQELAKKTLAALEFQDGEFFRPSAAIYKKNKVLSPAMKQFLAVLKGSARCFQIGLAWKNGWRALDRSPMDPSSPLRKPSPVIACSASIIPALTLSNSESSQLNLAFRLRIDGA